jgi:uncharacterized protein YneF (UPF0154 family)
MVIGVVLGILIGIVIGLAVGPSIRSWISWREYVEASREARLHEEILRLMSGSTADRASGDRSRQSRGG